MLVTETVLWMLETATELEPEDIRIAAEEILTIHDFPSARVIDRSPAFGVIVRQLSSLASAVARGESRSTAVSLARAIAHVIAADPEYCHRLSIPAQSDFFDLDFPVLEDDGYDGYVDVSTPIIQNLVHIAQHFRSGHSAFSDQEVQDRYLQYALHLSILLLGSSWVTDRYTIGTKEPQRRHTL